MVIDLKFGGGLFPRDAQTLSAINELSDDSRPLEL